MSPRPQRHQNAMPTSSERPSSADGSVGAAVDNDDNRDSPAQRSMPANQSLAEHQGALQSYFARQLRSKQDVEDHVQEVYRRVLASTARPDAAGNLKHFLLHVARNVVIDSFRRDRVRQRHQHLTFEDLPNELADRGALCPEATVSHRQQLGLAARILLTIAETPREAFLLARVEGYSHREVARRLGISEQAVGRHVQQVLFALERNGRQEPVVRGD
jgi:RNA polymerase sigma-70 factor (ECF subfamily)